MSSTPRTPAPVIVQPPTEPEVESIAAQAADVQAEKAKRKKKAGGTLLTGPEGVTGQAPIRKETLGA
jgi:hypothetical protein